MLFHKTSESDNTLAELYSILWLPSWSILISNVSLQKINYLLEYILENKQ